MHARESRPPAVARPRLVLSRCLDLEACRYNGALIRAPLVRALEPFVELIPVCPEVEIGLGVPREPVRLVRREGRSALVQPATGRDLTDAMAALAASFLDRLPEVEGFLLKARSPSCGIHGVKLFSDLATDVPAGRGVGMFAGAVLERFPDHPIEHEGRLENSRLRDHFFSSLFALGGVRAAREADASLESLRRVHHRQALIALTFETSRREALNRIVTAAARDRSGGVPPWDAYARALRVALTGAPSPRRHAEVVAHAWSTLAPRIGASEDRELEALRTSYLNGESARASLLARLRLLAAEVGSPLTTQSYLMPYPEALALIP